MKTIILAGAAAVALAANAAVAEDQKGAPKSASPSSASPSSANPAAVEKPLAASDVASIDDARAFAAAEFKRADKNVDGKLERAEFDTLFDAPVGAGAPSTIAAKPALRQPPATDTLFGGVAKADGVILVEELIEARVSAFRAADRNVDAKLDAEERLEFAALVKGEPPPAATN